MAGDTVFLFTHQYELDGYDTLKVLGMYSESAIAENSQAYFSTRLGFCEHGDGFAIQECQLDKNLWSEGYITYRHSLDSGSFTDAEDSTSP
jgi:hypothetical protein